MRAHELTGKRFGKLVVVRREGSRLNCALWLCQCDCGNSHLVVSQYLVAGKTVSCGCHKLALMAVATLRHGKTNTRTHSIWRGMTKRCRNPKTLAYDRYGGRGIKVCERWLSFENFLADMGEVPEGYSIERKNNDGDYEPGNCVWIPRGEQPLNTKVTRWITIGEETKPLAVWCRQYKIRYGRARDRIDRLGWGPLRALTEPSHA